MNPTIKAGLIGLARGLGLVIIGSVLTYLGNAEHISFLGPTVSGLIAIAALGLENALTAKTGNALFGAVRRA